MSTLDWIVNKISLHEHATPADIIKNETSTPQTNYGITIENIG